MVRTGEMRGYHRGEWGDEVTLGHVAGVPASLGPGPLRSCMMSPPEAQKGELPGGGGILAEQKGETGSSQAGCGPWRVGKKSVLFAHM